MDILKNVAAVIRTWSNNEHIQSSVHRALEAGIGQVIVIVKDEDPKLYGAVERRLADEISMFPERLHIITMRIGYGWSKALNVALEDIRQLNEFAKGEGKPLVEFVLNVSNEVLYTRQHVEALLAPFIENGDPDMVRYNAVGTSFKAETKDGVAVKLGSTYRLPRNTMMMIRFEATLRLGGFSIQCDDLGGMEDFEWLSRSSAFDYGWKMLDLQVPLLVGVNHNQEEKERREREAIRRIARHQAKLMMQLTHDLPEI